MAPVQLYVYDLSNGLARQLSLRMTGTQFDGIWHTSVVVFGQEIFYGQGISITAPGRSHHGNPLKVIDMGETAIDQETFTEYLTELREFYTAEKYHLLDFNCNSFTNDCIGFLTGGSIPPWIKDLPVDFLSTPFGAALRPTIDGMFRRPTSQTPTVIPSPSTPSTPREVASTTSGLNSQFTSSMLQALAASGSGSATGPSPLGGAHSTLPTSPLHIATNLASLSNIISTHTVVTVFFTSATCPPCRMIEPIFEDLARNKGRTNVAFVKVDLGVGNGSECARNWNVRATPTFIFFLNGNMTNELKGANAPELRTQVDLLLFQAFPPHPHTKLPLRTLISFPLTPITFRNPPDLNTVSNKLISFIDALAPGGLPDSANVKKVVTTSFVPELVTRFPSTKTPSTPSPGAISGSTLKEWSSATASLVKALPPAQLFPLVDLWRLAVLVLPSSSSVSAEVGTLPMALGAADDIFRKTIRTPNAPKPLLLTALRLAANVLAANDTGNLLFRGPAGSELVMGLATTGLLHADAGVRTAAASIAFNVATARYARRRAAMQAPQSGGGSDGDDGGADLEVEMVSALVEAIGRETGSEEVVYRLVGALGLTILYSPHFEGEIGPLLAVLGAKDVLEGRLSSGSVVVRTEVKSLVKEVAQVCASVAE
ncbi:hypothetical protein BOTBODRAFT_39329 [Botryobasidium botryosum FD-172 SS1]|uniref:PPPDE domain-containing protein n=1 Tax=Botryobasidium botryosum (strain FD-172 SS1) TaxID=930990 RepID=A0A067M5F3_BOTB1|nr:hypothetical protein BOTBODRAFT_39329 [Botryobasidium botryosum FD-172 SS1]